MSLESTDLSQCPFLSLHSRLWSLDRADRIVKADNISQKTAELFGGGKTSKLFSIPFLSLFPHTRNS